jgi:hypothetical protein
MALLSMPAYLNGFLLALRFTPLVARLTVELLSRAFERLPDSVLLPWLPGLLMMLRGHGGSVLPGLLKEASGSFPAVLASLLTWRPPWEAVPAAVVKPTSHHTSTLSPSEATVVSLLRGHRLATEAFAKLLGVNGSWSEPSASVASEANVGLPAEGAVQDLLKRHPSSPQTLARLLG